MVYQTSLPTETKITKLTNYIENQFNVNASSNGLEKDTTPDLNIRYVEGGKDTWFDGQNLIPYKYTNVIFLKFIEDKPKVDISEIILD